MVPAVSCLVLFAVRSYLFVACWCMMMTAVVWYVARVVRCLLCVDCCVVFAVRCLLFVVCLVVGCCVLSAHYDLLCDGCCLFVYVRSVLVVCWLVCEVCCLRLVVGWLLLVVG